jgi:hypothetical protein
MRGGARTLRQSHSKCDLLLAADNGDAELPVGSSYSNQRKIMQNVLELQGGRDRVTLPYVQILVA